MRCMNWNIGAEHSRPDACLTLYLLDDSRELAINRRPMVIVCPGGGYNTRSDREAESIAVQFTAMGYQAAVLNYSVAPAVFPTAMEELGRAILEIRRHADQWYVDPNEIVISGFSAGGHLAACYGVNWNQTWFAERLGVAAEELKPNGMILGYPVISHQFRHKDSFEHLLGDAYPADLDRVNIENNVGPQVPRTFIWATYEDQMVPVQNSLLMATTLADRGIPVELHVFEKGVHGLALSNRLTERGDGYGLNKAAAKWISLVHLWMESWTTL